MSHRIRSLVVVVGMLTLATTIVFRLGTGVSGAAVSSTLHASVGPGFDISLVFDDGTKVVSLPAGSYRILVSDVSEDHNFHLIGPGVEESTPVESLAQATWNVTFRNGGYRFQCDPHADEMNGTFDVGAAAAPPSPSAGSSGGSGITTGGVTQPAPATGRIQATLLAGVDSAGRLTFTIKGKAVKTLPGGSYKLVIADGSAKNDVTLRRIGAAGAPITSVPFVGRRTITTQFAAGRWKLYSSRHEAASSVFFTVTKP